MSGLDDLAATIPPDDSELRRSLNNALRQLDKIKNSKAELAEAVYSALRDAAAATIIPPVPPARKDARRKHEEVAVVMLSDWQLGKTTPTYNSDVCEERIHRLADKVIRLTAIQRADHPVRSCRIWNLGDLGEGEQVFPGQAHRIDASIFRQLTEGQRIYADFSRRMLGAFNRVGDKAVDGNHSIGGPGRHEFHPETSLDRMIAYGAHQLLAPESRFHPDPADPRGERNWYTIDTIGNYRSLLFHGDQIRGGFAGFPWYGTAKKIWGWTTAIKEPFQDAAFGHFHTPARMTLNRITARCNGSTESDNTYALEQLASAGRPSQWLLFVDPEAGMVTAEYCVWLD